ncbi:MAG TPA: glycosyltransferase family 39 protein [Streptosporangiaceae bacterium]|nr:glycosyltransferase family 39 protein [Streptosporangiaceae bacterium]
MDAAAGDYPAGDPGASGADRDRALPGLSEAFQTGPIPAAESGQRSGQALRAAAVMPVAGPFDRRVIWVGGIVFAVLMALSPRYGFDRDELYFLDGARHLQASYVDQPVLGPLLAWVSLKLFGVSLPGLRVWPALAAWATVVVGGLIAREFGGGKRAQLLAAIGTATMPVLLGAAHVADTTAYELLAWAGLALVVARIGRTGDCRWWLAWGLVAGLGVADDHSMSFFAIALVIGALLSGGRPMIWNRWFLAGAAIAVAFEVPDLWWQAQHGWATIAMTHALSQENGGLANIATFVFGQLGMVTLALAWVWVAGLRFLWRSGRPLWRAMAWAYGLLFVLFAVTTGAQTYYLGAAYVYLLAAGAVAIDAWLQARPGRLRNLLLASALTTAVAVLIVLPVLPAADIAWTYKTNPTLGETVGWPQFVQTVDGAWKSLPPSQQASAVIFTADYGEAAAINELGRGTGLPTAVSGDNTEWWWGPGNPHATIIVAVMPGPVDVTGFGAYLYLTQFFTFVRVAATLSNPYGLHNQEWGGHVYICTGPRQPWAQIWPQLRHYS